MLALWAVAAWVRLRAVEHAIVGSDSLGPYLQAKAALLGHLPRPPNPESGDALWMLADLTHHRLMDPTTAQSLYEKLLFEFPGSLYAVEARKRFRTLRGDELE